MELYTMGEKIMSKNILVVTPPRSGTHLIMDAIEESIGVPYRVYNSFDYNGYKQTYVNQSLLDKNKVDISKRYTIGLHVKKTKEIDDLFSNYIKITANRNPLGQALSIMNFVKSIRHDGYDYQQHFTWCAEIPGEDFVLSRCDPNSQEFINYVLSDRFMKLRSISSDWDNGNNLLSSDKLMDHDKNEIQRLSNILEADIKLINLKERPDKIGGVTFIGQANYWKKIFSQDTADILQPYFPDYDLTTEGNSSDYGNKIYSEDLVEKIYAKVGRV
jgi:hypothetical protein